MSGDPTRRALVAGAGAAVLCAAAPVPTHRRTIPRRIVSLNPCLDVILVHVADRRQIAALSHWSSEEGSAIPHIARRYASTYGSAEEVVALAPDLVLTGSRNTPATQHALERMGIVTEVFGVPETIADSLAQVRSVARLIGQAARGEAMVARIERAIRAAAPPPGTPAVSALVFMPGGFASGPGTLMDELMRRAGLANAITRYGFTQSRSVPLELLVADPPQLLLSSESRPGVPGWAQRVMEHPALAQLATRMHRAAFPQRLLYCGGPVMIESIAALASARRSVTGA